jgi:EAL domain-containing protein (putative c-di-GMP-specific phosphodiesterase class I)
VDQLVVEAIVNVARGMGKKTVAEFVADEESAGLLREIGVDCAQGYHIGMPRPISEVLGAGAALT